MIRSTRWTCWALSGLLTTAAALGADRADRRPPRMTVLESIDMGDVLVLRNDTIDVEVTADGQRSGPVGPPVFGSLPFGSGRLRLLGEPGACVRLTAHRLGRRAGGDHIQVTRVLLRGPNARGHEAIDLRLDAHGLAVVEVGVRMRVKAIERSNRWQLPLSLEARYGEDCLD